MNSPASPPRWQSALLIILLLLGLAINAMLLFWKLSDNSGKIAGCSGGSPCGEVLASRWSTVFGAPVVLLGVAVYLLLLVSWVARKQRIFAAGLAMLVGSVLWFAFLQARILGKFCPWCLAAHTIAVATVVTGFLSLPLPRCSLRRSAMIGFAAVLLLIAAQIFGPVPASHRIDENARSAVASAADIHARGEGRKIVFDEIAKTFDVTVLPRLGSADAKHVLVEYFDYRCPACRTMHGFLEALVAEHPDIAVIVLPVPMERSCNRLLGPNDTLHPGSCELARIALAVWRTEPAAFAEMHRAFFAEVTSEAALDLARSKVHPERLDLALKDPWLDEVLKVDAEDWIVFSKTSRHLPKLLITGRRILHGLPSGEGDFIRVMEQELGL